MNRTRQASRAAVTVAVLAGLAYVSAVPNALTNWDDRALVLAEPAAKSLDASSISQVLRSPVGKAYLPLRTLSYAADHAIWGHRAWGYHLTNVLLHAANAALAFAVVARLCASTRAGLLCAILFAVHPMQTESVAWVAGRRDVLSALFYLSAVAWYMRAMLRSERALAAGGLLILACLSKGTSVVFPAAALLLECFWLPARAAGRAMPAARRRLVVRQAAAWVIAGAMIAVHVSVGRSKQVIRRAHGGSARVNVATMSKAFTSYLAAMAWPVHLSALRHFPPVRAVGWLLGPALFAAAAVGLLASRRARLGGIGLAWFGIGLLPVSGIVFPLSCPYAERYVYVPCVGLLMLAAWRFSSRRPTALLGAAAALSALTIARTFDWRTSETLWRSAVRVCPRSGAAAKSLLFTHLEDKKRHCALAAAQLMRSTDADPFITRLLLAQMLFRVGRYVPARGQAVHAVAACRSDPRGYVVAGDIERALGETAAAKNFYEKAVALDDACGEAHFGLGVISEKRQPRLALRHYKAAAKLTPDNAEVHYNLANVLAELRYNASAEQAYREAVRIAPQHAKALCNLGTLHMNMGHLAKAADAFARALQVDPRLVQAHLNLAVIEEACGRRPAAIARLERLLQQRPGLAQVRQELDRMRSERQPK